MYSTRITRRHRTAFIMLCDRSGSMAEEVVFRGERTTKAAAVASIINMFIDELINRSRREEGVRDYFDIAVLEYSGDGVIPLLGPAGFVPVSELVRREVRTQRFNLVRTLPNGNQIVSAASQRCWIEPKASGATLMGAALTEAGKLVRKWCSRQENRGSFPPVVINITDGEASDAEYGALCDCAEHIKGAATLDGSTLLFNIHLAPVAEGGVSEVRFPCGPEELPCHRYARLLYDMSSTIPECYDGIVASVRNGGGSGLAEDSAPSRAMAYNCPVDELFSMLTIGSISIGLTA